LRFEVKHDRKPARVRRVDVFPHASPCCPVAQRKAAAALAALAIAGAAATAMLNLYVDVQVKLRKEFRKFGANIIIEAKPGEGFSPDAFAQIQSAVAGRGLAVPFAYAVARSDKGQPVVVAGADLEQVQRLNPWWSVTNWPHAPDQALIGARAAQLLSPDGKPFTLRHEGREIHVSPVGTVRTGAGEDSRVYLSLSDFQQWTHLAPSVVELTASGTNSEIASLLQQLQRQLPNADVRPVRQITEGEARILGKTRLTLLSSASFIVLTTALCVLATLTGWVVDRRRDFAIMKALGASDRLIALFVAGEAAALAAAGTILGFAAGIGIAALIGRINFNAPVAPRFSIFPAVLLGSLLVTLIATLVPLRLLRRIQPAMILRGE
jgi:putative ABC transport system permease protein